MSSISKRLSVIAYGSLEFPESLVIVSRDHVDNRIGLFLVDGKTFEVYSRELLSAQLPDSLVESAVDTMFRSYKCLEEE